MTAAAPPSPLPPDDLPPMFPPADLAALIRRCADGELTDPDRTALLARLTADPAGYEPLALALLERRTTDDAVRAFLRPDGADAEGGAAAVTVAAPPPRRRWATAAGWVASAAAGLLAGVSMNASPVPVAGPVASSEPAAPVVEEDAPPPAPVAALTWTAADGTAASLPVYDGRVVPAELAAAWADPLPPGVRAELIRTGRFAGEVRQEYTVPLEDGSLLTVPVHAVSVRGPEVF